MFLCCELSCDLVHSPRHDQVLTGIPPDDDDNKATVIADIRPVRRPSRPLDPSQNRWLLDRVWDVIETCWSDKPERRYELPVVCHVFLTPSCQDALFESPPVGRENLIRLAGELLYTFSILPLDPGERATLRTMQEYISKAISRGGTSPANLSSTEAAALAETSREVSFSHRIFPQSLKFPTVRQRRSYHPTYDLPRFACGSGFTPTPSSSNHRSSQT